MIRFIYNLLWPIGLLFFLPGYLLKMFRRGGYRRKFGQRLGFYSIHVRLRLRNQRSVWLHAVSVGEVSIALKLADKTKILKPDTKFILTTTTTTGFAFAKANAADWIEVMYTPLDFWPIMMRAFSVIRPERIVLVEAEVWPNLVAIAHQRKIPVALVNARLSLRSERRFRRFLFFVEPTFRRLDLVCVQKSEDAKRWAALGVDPARIKVTYSIKYDTAGLREQTTAPHILPGIGAHAGRPVFFGGSTHSGEELVLGRVFLELRRSFPSLVLFVAPRHVERVRQVRKQLESLSLGVRLTSETFSSSNAPDCVILNRTGELQRWYGLATVAFVGKSLEAHGGQNPVEPIVAGVPVIFGPHMGNFAAIASALVEKGGAIQVKNAEDLKQNVDRLLRDENARRVLVQNAEAVIAWHRGATERTARLVVDLAGK